MKNEPNEIHFDCPKCKRPMSGDKALLGEMITCPDCGEAFIPTPKAQAAGEYKSWAEYLASPESKKAARTVQEEVSAAAAMNEEQRAELENRLAEAKASHAEKIHDLANLFGILAAMLLVVAAFFLIGAFVSASGNGPSAGLLIAAGGCFATALWLYLIAQVIHIRANTEK